MARLTEPIFAAGRSTRVQVVTVYVSNLDRAVGFYRDQRGLHVGAEWRVGDGGDLEFEIGDPDGNRIVVHS